MSVQFNDCTRCLPIEPTLLKTPQSSPNEVGLLDQDAGDLGLGVTVAAPGPSHASLVDPSDHRHLGVDVGEVILPRSSSAEAVQLAVDRFPASFIALDRLRQPGSEIGWFDRHGSFSAP